MCLYDVLIGTETLQLCNKFLLIVAVRYIEVNINTIPKVVSAIERCPVFLFAMKRFFCEALTKFSSVRRKSVLYREVSAIKHVSYREVPLYLKTVFYRMLDLFIRKFSFFSI